MKKIVLISFAMIFMLTIVTGVFTLSQNKGVRIRIKNLAQDNQVGKQYLVLIAINKYKNWSPLYRPVKDAREIREILESRYYIDEVWTLYDEKATKEGQVKEWIEKRADRISTPEYIEGDSFKFPRLINYKILKKGNVLGSCQYYYEEKINHKDISYLKLKNFRGLGYSLNESLSTYIFSENLSLYASFFMSGKDIISDVRSKEILGFDGQRNLEYVFREGSKPEINIHRDHFIRYKVIDFLSSFLVTSKKVANGDFKHSEKFQMIINSKIPIVQTIHLGDEKVPFQGKLVNTIALSIVLHHVEVLRFNIIKEESYCFPVRVVMNDEIFKSNSEIKYINTLEQGKIFVSNLSFMDVLTQMITIRPMVYSKAGKVVLIKNLQFRKEDIFCEDLSTRKKILCPDALLEISYAVQELLERLEEF